MKILFRILILMLVSAFVNKALAQSVLTQQEAVDLALKNSPVHHGAKLEVIQNKQLQGTSFNLANPEIIFESPTGEFMTMGVSQSFEFPGVYIKQGQLAKQRTALSENEKAITEASIKQQVRSAYLSLQIAKEKLVRITQQDSIYKSISNSANRQFEAGQVDYVVKTLSASQYSEMHNLYVEAKADYEIAAQLVRFYTGVNDSVITDPVMKYELPGLINIVQTDSAALMSVPLIKYHDQSRSVAVKSLQLERSKAWPGFSIGYMNQGPDDTDFPLRLNAGISIPLWYWQYSASIKAAKTNVQITEQNILAQRQEFNIKIQQEKGNALKFQSSLNYYESNGLKQVDELISASSRMFAAGQIDYITHLRTMSDAYNIQLRYLETLRNYNQSVININYLIGQ